MCLYLYTEPVVCTCIHVHLHAQEPVGVNVCVCTVCGRQRLVRAISLNICPHFVLGQGFSLIWNSPFFGWTDCPVSPSDLPVSVSTSSNSRHYGKHAAL